MDEALLARLDVVYVAIHSKFKMPRDAMTKRVVRALENPYANVLAHPTGRLIGMRDAFEIDMQEVIRAAARTGTAIEINAHPARLDLDAANCRAAAAAGVMIGIGTDTHVLSELDYMIYGIGTARRGWLTKANILNTRPRPRAPLASAEETPIETHCHTFPHMSYRQTIQPNAPCQYDTLRAAFLRTWHTLSVLQCPFRPAFSTNLVTYYIYNALLARVGLARLLRCPPSKSKAGGKES